MSHMEAPNPQEKFVLLVEDNDDDAELTIRAFERNRLANRLIHLPGGPEALDFLFCRAEHAARDPRQQPTLILLDVNMPRMNGHDVLAAIRANPLTRHLPVVMLTSSDDDKDLRRAYEIGVNSYVRKPVEFDEFFQAIQNLGIYWMVLNLNAPSEAANV